MLKSMLTVAALMLATVSFAHDHHDSGDPPAAHDALQILTVESVSKDSPAAAAGVRHGDRIVRLDGREIGSMDDLQEVMAGHQPGEVVPLAVEREGKLVELQLKFGTRSDGGVSIGVSIAVGVIPGSSPTGGTVGCLEWIEETYGIESLIRELDLDLAERYATIRACVESDTRRLDSVRAIQYCPNIFKVHCDGLDLLAELGEAQVLRCESQLGESLDLELKQHKSWKTCAQHKVYDRYSMTGEPSDAEACKAALLECEAQTETATP